MTMQTFGSTPARIGKTTKAVTKPAPKAKPKPGGKGLINRGQR